jgi:hypothetical protein
VKRLLVLLAVCCGCAQRDADPPPFDVARVARVVADLHVAQSLINEIPLAVRDSMQAIYYDSTLAQYELTRPEFDSLMFVVRQEPAWVDSVYTRAGEIVATEMVRD